MTYTPEEGPPEYGSEYTCEPITVKNAMPQMLKIQFHNPKPSFDVGDTIFGTLKVSVSSKDIDVHSLTIALKGEEVTTKSTFLHDHLIQRTFSVNAINISGLPPDNILKRGFLYYFPFSIQIPHKLKENCCKQNEAANGRHLRLPPTFGSRPESLIHSRNVPGNVARVTYYVSALLARYNENTGQTVTPVSTFETTFSLLPSYPISPNYLVPPKQPFRAFQEVYSRRKKKQICGTIELQIDRAAIISIDKASVSTIPVIISYFPGQWAFNKSSGSSSNSSSSSSSNRPRSPSPEEDIPTVVGFSSFLKARTVYSIADAMVHCPTSFTNVKPVQYNNCLHELINPVGKSINLVGSGVIAGDSQKEVFQITRLSQGSMPSSAKWHRVSVAGGNGKPRMESCHMHFAMPLTVPSEDKSLLPNYESCYTMRDHTLIVSVALSNGSNVNLEIPALVTKGSEITTVIPSYGE